jgi:4-carboxymuconolactone decarboxylase
MTFLPAPYKRFQKEFPEVSKAYSAFAQACHEHGPLDEKTRRLVKLGVAVGICSEGAVKSHARRALGAGATVEEVRHAALLGMSTIGFPKTIAALEWIDEVVDAQ